jgi:uncharacterized protein
MRSSSTRCAVLWLLAALLADMSLAVEQYAPYPQPDSGYVTDAARVLSPAEEERIEQWLKKVEDQTGTEIIVVTIGSIADYPGTDNSSIESFAMALFNRWGIGNRPRNDGVLLLVAIRDRKARIELGGGYSRARDRDAERIMRDVIVPRFRKGDYPGGITAGVKAIVAEFTSMRIGIRWDLIVIPIVVIILLATGISLIKNGRRGWGWVFVGLALLLSLVLVYLVVAMSRASKSSDWAPGGSGGFGGGFSSGGGATGSW